MTRRIIAAFAALFVLFSVGIAAFGLSLLRSTAELRDLVARHEIQELRQTLSLQAQRTQTDLLTSGTTFSSNLDAIIANVRALDESVKQCVACHHEPATARRLQDTVDMVQRYQEGFSRYITAMLDEARRNELQMQASAIGTQIAELVSSIVFEVAPKLRKRTDQVQAGLIRSGQILVVVLSLTFLLAGSVGWFVLRGITGPLGKLQASTAEISRGRFGGRIEHRESGDIGRLLDAFNGMSASLRDNESRISGYVRRLTRLNHAVVSFQAAPEHAVFPSRVVSALASLVDAEAYGTVLPASRPGTFVLRVAAAEVGGAGVTAELSRGLLLAAHDRQGGQPVLTNEAGASDWPFGPMVEGVSLRSLLVVWLESKDELKGALLVVNKRDDDLLGEDRDLVAILANGLSVALENLTLYHDLQRQVEQLKEAQRHVVQAEKLSALGTLAGGIAHDFNNILSAILGHAQLLKASNALPDGAGARSLDVIETAAGRAGDLTRQLLAFSRQGRWDTQRVEVNRGVQHVTDLLRRSIDKRIEIALDLEEPTPAAQADASQFEQVVMNLCVNARDAMTEGGVLAVRTETVSLDGGVSARHGATPGRYVHLAVRDTGTGIPEENLGRIFDPFFTTKEVGRGTGLGLSTVYGILRNHRGFCEVESEVGKGSTFHVYLPAATTTTAPPLRRSPGALRQGHGGILVVDDEEMVRSFLLVALAKLGYRTWEAADGRQAVEALAAHRDEVSLVLLDVNMPVMGGLEAYRALREAQPGLKVLLMTGFVLENDAEKILAEGALGLLQKPFTLDQVSARIADALAT